MAMTYEGLLSLARTVAKADAAAPTAYSFNDKNYTYDQLNDTLRSELNGLVATPQLYRENKNMLYSLVEEIITEVVPKQVYQMWGAFAEIRHFAQGEKAIFALKVSEASKKRAKKFVTKVGLAGVYEVFKLDGYRLEVPVTAFGGAAEIGWEEYLDGRIDMADVVNIIKEGLNEAVYTEIAKALKSCVNNLPATNFAQETGFVQATMDRLIQTADVYGHSTIYCTYEFAATMVPDQGWVSDDHKNTLWSQGYIANYKGHNVVILPQTFEDATNTTKVVDASLAYIIPTGADKPIKIAFEGQAQTREWENKDWSREFQTYMKFGVGMVGINPGICVYQNSNFAPKAKTLVKKAAPGLDAEYTA